MDDDNNSLLSGVDLDSDLSIDPSMLSTPGDRHSATSFQDINDMNMTFTDMIGGASDANMSFLGDSDGPCDVDWSSIQFLHAEDEPSQTSLMFPSQGESSQATTAPTTAMTSFSIPAPSRDTYSSQNSNFADPPAPNTQTNTFTTKPVFSVSQQPSANAPHPHQHHQQPQDQQHAPNAATPTPTQAPAPAPRQGYKTVWPGWTTANTSNTPCPIFGGPHPPKIYEYRPPTFGPHGNQDKKHPPPPPPADEHGIRTDLTTQEAVADAAKVAFVKGAAWCLTALVRQVNHELKTQGTMFGFKPDKKVRKQEVVRKTVTDYFQNNNPPTLAALACAEEVGRMFGRHYPALFLPIPGAKELQKLQMQPQRNSNLQNTGAAHGSIPVYMGDGPVPAMYMATIPDTAMASVPTSSTAVPSSSTTASANSQSWQASSSSQVPSSAPARSTTSPTSGPAPAITKQQMRTGKKKDKLYALTGAFREVKHNGEVITTWQCTDNQYRLMDEVYGEAGTAVKSSPTANRPPQVHNASPVSTQPYSHIQVVQANTNPLYMQQHNQQQQPAQGQYIPTSSPATNSIGHIYTYHGPNKQADPRTYLSPQIQQQQQQSLYVLSPQQGPAASVPKRKRAPDAESAAPLTKRRGKNNVSEAVLSQSRG
ncbi:hypothetical protein K4F52_008888 [Lecanicillium sp. MT-2017a]|nr:hypothetical protein K4F52_008888 [Lecanicillium sp. MT-2017a]